ncbi:MAG: prepilin-type N-terminal cleavage/methylation domain-containing protein [Betaproteobacteria bacterium]|nr:prepilin-type N-terminal cleavage/methylation domain-containing protein [Betaproteobacteria bacterium]
MKKQQSGFTLVEIAIVLVIIGLLLGGVLKGQELITQAKISNITNDINSYISAIYSYQDRYRALPGDDRAATRWPLITAAGDGNNSVGGAYESTTNTDESRLFWAELRLAGFIHGAVDTLPNAVVQPVSASGGIIGVQQNPAPLGLGLMSVCAGSLPAKIAQAIDAKLDDGNAMTGTVRSLLQTAVPMAVTATAPTVDYVDLPVNLYVLCRSI